MTRKRDYHLYKKCAHPGCREKTFFVYTSRREYNESSEHNRAWRCCRHSGSPSELLSPTNLETRAEFVSAKSERCPELPDFFWHGDCLCSKFASGPGFKAFTDDFPEGTKIVITTKVILPEEQTK